jgi:colanic acid/amylovoran biosynthesis glycosyltransferase
VISTASPPRLILLSPYPRAGSETFIRAHYDKLPFSIVGLHRWRAPYVATEGGWLALWPGVLCLLTERLRFSLLSRLASFWSDQAVARWLRRSRACAVLAEYGPLGAGIAPACREAGLPLIVIFHGFDAFMESTLAKYQRAYQDLFSIASVLVAVSEPMRLQLIALGAPAERIVVNPCGVDTAVFQPSFSPCHHPLFLFVGRFVGKKGPLQTIRAFAHVHRLMPSCRLTMIGTGPLFERSRTFAEELGIRNAISFLGACSHETVQAYMHQARAVVQHSMRCGSGDQEGTPVALIEAHMCGVPVVSTIHAGIPAVVLDGQTGFLVSEGDVEAMAEAMFRMAEDPQLAAQMGAAARSHALLHHSMDRHIKNLTATIQQAINQQSVALTT